MCRPGSTPGADAERSGGSRAHERSSWAVTCGPRRQDQTPITLSLKLTFPSRADCGALVLRVFCGCTVSAEGGSRAGVTAGHLSSFWSYAKGRFVVSSVKEATRKEGGLLCFVWVVFQGRTLSAAGGSRTRERSSWACHMRAPTEPDSVNMVLEKHISQQS